MADSITETSSAEQALTDKQLMMVAETLGKEWEQAALHLGLETKDLDDIKAEHRSVAMQKHKMLVLWRCQRPPGKATAKDLLRGLKDLEDLPVETRQLLSGELRRIRSEFIERVSYPVIKGLLDDLWQRKVFSTEDKDYVMEYQRSRMDWARCLIDMVISKGERASRMMIDSMKKRDPYLSSTLGLMPSPAWDLKAEVKLKSLFSRARDKKTRFAGQDLSDKQLLQVAETLGQEWEQAAIHLELSITDLDDIKADRQTDVAMQKLKMLRLWKRQRPPGEATALDLLRGLEDLEDLPVETRLLLEGRALSNEQLLKVAETLGKEWEQVAIHLDLKTKDLDGIKAENMTVIMQKYKMLQLWQSQRPFGKDTAQYLLRGLEDMEDVPVETRLLLTGFGRSQESFGSGQEGPGLMSPSLPLEMHEGDSELGYVTKDLELDLISEDSGIESMADSDSSSESSSSGSMSESELSVGGRMLGLGDDKMVVKPKKQRRVPSAVFDEEDEDLWSKVERWNTGTSLTEDTASMSLMDRHEEEDGSDSDPLNHEDDEEDEEEMHFKTHCEKCEAAQLSPEYEKVTPTKISKWSFQVQLEGEGTYECSATGLVFEVSEQALVRYSVLSWFQFSEFLPDSWRPAGSVYDVDVVNKDSSVLKFIHFPHSLSLTEPDYALSFSVLHVKERNATIESTVDFTTRHVKWCVSSLSAAGPIIRRSVQAKHYGAVLIYKERNKKRNKYFFQVYLASNNASEIKAIEETVRSFKQEWIKINKPPTCMLEEKYYYLTSVPERKIEPSKLQFVTELLPMKQFSEARFDEGPPFKLILKDSFDSDEHIWFATISKDDLNGEKKLKLCEFFRRLFCRKKTHTDNIKLTDGGKYQQIPPAAGEGTSVQSSPLHPLEHPEGQATSSPPVPSSATQPAVGELQRIHREFLERVTIPVIKDLLEDLHEHEVFSKTEVEFVMNEKIRKDRARWLIDMVIGKGGTASQKMIDCMKERDKHFCIDLGLIMTHF